MTSDDLFWRLVLASRSLDEAALLWWLAAVRADEIAYRSSSQEIATRFGNAVNRKAILRSSGVLKSEGLIEARTVKKSTTKFRLAGDQLVGLLGQNCLAQSWSALGSFDPFSSTTLHGARPSTAWSRVCILRGNREEPILLAWLHASSAHVEPLRVSSREMASALDGRVDRRTAMRALARLELAGLVSITSLGRAGTEYRLSMAQLSALLGTFPFPEDAAATMPGWASLSFPLLERLGGDLFAGAETTQAAEVAALEA